LDKEKLNCEQLLLYVVLYCIVFRYLYSTSHSVSLTEVLLVHFSSRKKVRHKAKGETSELQ